jgi:hypothetical protein
MIIDEVNTIVTFEYLKNISADQVYLYLKKNAENKNILVSDNDYIEIEKLLLNLNEPLINLGLAQHGYCPDVIRQLFVKGKKEIRLAALMNRKDNFHITDTSNRSWIDNKSISEIMASHNQYEKYALLSNPLLGSRLLESLFERKEPFDSISDDAWQKLIEYAGDNKLIRVPYDSHYFDGFTDYSDPLQISF